MSDKIKVLMSKTCTKCKRHLSIVRFTKHKKTKDGRQSWCKDCKAIGMQEYRRRKRSGWNYSKQMQEYRRRNRIDGL